MEQKSALPSICFLNLLGASVKQPILQIKDFEIISLTALRYITRDAKLEQNLAGIQNALLSFKKKSTKKLFLGSEACLNDSLNNLGLCGKIACLDQFEKESLLIGFYETGEQNQIFQSALFIEKNKILLQRKKLLIPYFETFFFNNNVKHQPSADIKIIDDFFELKICSDLFLKSFFETINDTKNLIILVNEIDLPKFIEKNLENYACWIALIMKKKVLYASYSGLRIIDFSVRF